MCVIIVKIQDIYAGIVESFRIKIEDLSPFITKNHLKSASTFITTLVELGKINTCFLSSSSSWVIDSGATDHMTSNSSLFTMFQSHPSTSTITLADESTSRVLGSKIIHPTPSITLTFVLSLPQFFFNLILCVNSLIHLIALSLFFLDYCPIQDFSMKWVIDRECEFEGLYILETKVPTPVVCSGVVTPFELHCCLGHPSLYLLKKLYT